MYSLLQKWEEKMEEKKDWVVMRHADILRNGHPTGSSVAALFFNAKSLARFVEKRKVIVYHSETIRAARTAVLLCRELSKFNVEAEVGGELDELDSTDPLLRQAIKRPVAEGTFVVYISHKPIIESTFKVTDVPHCAMFFPDGSSVM